MNDIAKYAFLTTPAPGVYLLNFQRVGDAEIQRIEISKAHLANIVIDGASFALRETSVNRVPETAGAHENV